jgi:uncharacterized protein (DUF58 family)
MVIGYKSIAIYIFAVLIFYLAAFYLGSFFMFIFFAAVLVPALSIFQVLVTAVGLKYNQNFSTEHPLKGEAVLYRLIMSKESILPSSRVIIRFIGRRQGTDLGLTPRSAFLKNSESFESSHEIRCPYRGIYSVGLESLAIEDSLKFLTLKLPVWHRTFYVYPRIIHCNPFFSGAESGNTSVSGSAAGGIEDHTLVESLSTYRPGLPVRHLAWKKFASLGEPVLRKYESTSRPGVSIYLDTRLLSSPGRFSLEAEDCSIEIMIALVRHFIGKNTPVSVCADGWDRYFLERNDEELFSRFHKATINIFFKSAISPAELFETDVRENRLTSNTVLFISHSLDPQILDLVENRSGETLSIWGIINLSGVESGLKEKALRYIETRQEAGHTLVPIHNAETIKEDLEG